MHNEGTSTYDTRIETVTFVAKKGSYIIIETVTFVCKMHNEMTSTYHTILWVKHLFSYTSLKTLIALQKVAVHQRTSNNVSLGVIGHLLNPIFQIDIQSKDLGSKISIDNGVDQITLFL